jgi:hypothetical protein
MFYVLCFITFRSKPIVSNGSHRLRYKFNLTYRRNWNLTHTQVITPLQTSLTISESTSTFSQSSSSSVSQDLLNEGSPDIQLTGHGVDTYHKKLENIFLKYETLMVDSHTELSFNT